MPQLRINSAALLTALKQASALIPNNSVVPILENVLLQVTDGQVTVTASNMEADLSLRLPSDGMQMDSFSICLPAKLLLTALSNLPAQPITLEVDLDALRAVLKAGKGRYQLAGESASDWPRPAVQTSGELIIDGPALAAAIYATAPFVATDMVTKPVMCMVNLQVRPGQQLRTVGCDGFRVSWHDLATGVESRELQQASYLIPGPVARLLAGLCAKSGPIKLEVGAWLRAYPAMEQPASWQLSCRLSDERYPDYENVIPINNPNVLVADRGILQQAVRRCAAFANATTNQMRLELTHGQVLRVSSEDLDFSKEADEEVEGTSYTGEDMNIGFNAKMLLDCLAVLPDGEIQIALSTPNRSGIFAPVGVAKGQPVTQLLLMPVQLNQYQAA